MKLMVKNIACIVLSLSVIASVSACGKKKETSGCVDAAETFLEAAVSLDAKKVKKLSKSDIDESVVEQLKVLASDEYASAVMSKASYEIDEDSVKEKKKTASCKATVSMPDYEQAYSEADGDIDEFIDQIESQKTKKYMSVEVTLKFEVEDGEYTLSNAQDVFNDIYNPMISALGGCGLVDPIVDDDDSNGNGTSQLGECELKKTDFDKQSFQAAIESAEDSPTFSEYDPAGSDLVDKKVITDFVGIPANFEKSYVYYEFASVEDASAYFQDFYQYWEALSQSSAIESDWGYVYSTVEDMTTISYFSGTSYFIVTSFSSSAEEMAELDAFLVALGAK